MIRDAFDVPARTEGADDIRPPAPPPQFPGATEQGRRDYTEMMIDFGHRKLKPRTTYSFPETLAKNPAAKGIAALERAAGSADTTDAEDDSLAYWGDIGAVTFDEIAAELHEGYSGKANGGRLPQ